MSGKRKEKPRIKLIAISVIVLYLVQIFILEFFNIGTFTKEYFIIMFLLFLLWFPFYTLFCFEKQE